MSRYTLKPGDLLMVDPVRPGINPTPCVVAENGVDLMWQYNPTPWHLLNIKGLPGLTVKQAEEVLQGVREYEGAVIYKVFEEATQTSFAPPDSVLEEIERRQASVETVQSEPGEVFDKIKPAPIDFTTPKGGIW